MNVGFAYALIGGALGLFSPCNALLIPAVLAHVSTSHRRLGLLAVAYFTGTLIVLLPLGLVSGGLASWLNWQPSTLIFVGGWAVIVLGVVQILGGGLNLAALLPASLRATAGSERTASISGAVVLGITSGLGSFCTGPVLGAILTIAATTANPIHGGLLLIVYAIGMAIPIIVVAALVRRIGMSQLGFLRGRHIDVGPFTVHSTMAIVGAITIIVGVIMVSTDGLAGTPELLPHSRLESLTALGRRLDDVVPGWAWPSLLAVIIFGWWARVLFDD